MVMRRIGQGRWERIRSRCSKNEYLESGIRLQTKELRLKRFENEGGQFGGQIAHVSEVEWSTLFLWTKRIRGDGVIN